MLRSIQKLIGDKRKQLIFPIFLMSLDAIGSLVMYLMLYFTVIHLLNGSLTGGLVRNYTIVCLISIILRLIIYRSGYFLCFSRGAEMCSGLRLDLANHYRSLSLGYFNQNSSGYLLSTLTKDLSNFELVLTLFYQLETGVGRVRGNSDRAAGFELGQPACREVRNDQA